MLREVSEGGDLEGARTVGRLQESKGERKGASEYPNGKDGRDWDGRLNLCGER